MQYHPKRYTPITFIFSVVYIFISGNIEKKKTIKMRNKEEERQKDASIYLVYSWTIIVIKFGEDNSKVKIIIQVFFKFS